MQVRRLAVAALVAIQQLFAGVAGTAHAAPPALPQPRADITATMPRVNTPRPAQLLFTPIPPCLAFDTRVAGGRVAVGERRNFYVTGSARFTDQGGTARGCGVPAYARAISISLTSVSSVGNGSLGVVAPGTSNDSVVLSFRRNEAITAGTEVEIATNRILVRAAGAATHVVGYITGYYQTQISGTINYAGAIIANSGAVVSAEKVTDGLYYVTLDREITGCSIHAAPVTTGGVYANGWMASAKTIYLWGWTLGPTANVINFAVGVSFSIVC